jgi:hypothetical protein
LGSLPRFFKLVVMSPFVSQLPNLNFSMPSKKDSMAVLRGFIKAGKITPVIDRTYPLSEVPEAIRYLEGDTLKGKSSSPYKANPKEDSCSPSGGEGLPSGASRSSIHPSTQKRSGC